MHIELSCFILFVCFSVFNEIISLYIPILCTFLKPPVAVYIEYSEILSLLNLVVRNFSFINFSHTKHSRIFFMWLSVFGGSFVFCGLSVLCNSLLSVNDSLLCFSISGLSFFLVSGLFFFFNIRFIFLFNIRFIFLFNIKFIFLFSIKFIFLFNITFIFLFSILSSAYIDTINQF